MAAIPFKFVVDELFQVDPVVKPMFGCHSIYVNKKLVLVLRKKDTHMRDNGVWVSTTVEHHTSLKKDIPSLRTVELFGSKVSAWQNIPEESPDFEESVLTACSLILKNDPRIGTISKKRNTKAR